MAKKAGAKKAATHRASKRTDSKRAADAPVKPIKTSIGRGTTRTPRTLPASGE